MSHEVQLTVLPPVDDKTNLELVSEVYDPEIAKFEAWFSAPERGNGPLDRIERDLLRSYFYFKIKVQM